MISNEYLIENGELITSDVINKPIDGVLQYFDDLQLEQKKYSSLYCDFTSGEYFTFDSPVGFNPKQYADIFNHIRETQVIEPVPNFGDVVYGQNVPVFKYENEYRIGLWLTTDEVSIDLTKWDWFNDVTGEFIINVKDASNVDMLALNSVPLLENVSGDFIAKIRYFSGSIAEVYIDGTLVNTKILDFSDAETLTISNGNCVIERMTYEPFCKTL